MKSNLSLRQIQHLEARVDEIAFRSRRDEEEDSTGVKVAKKLTGAAAIGGATYGAVRADDAIRGAYKPAAGTGAFGQTPDMSRRAAYGQAANRAKAAYGKLDSVASGTGAFGQARKLVKPKLITRIGRAAQAVFKSYEPLEINEFAALLEFEHPSQVSAKRKNQDPGGNWGRGVGMGLVGSLGSIGPAAAGAQNANQYREAKAVYRKRDAAKDGAVGLLGGVGGAMAAHVGANAAIASHAKRHGKDALDSMVKHSGKVGIASSAAALAGGYAASRALAKRRLRKIQEQSGK